MRRQLAVDRMTDEQLWRTLAGCVGTLERSEVAFLTWGERRGLAHRAAECVAELRLRGQQLQMRYGNESK